MKKACLTLTALGITACVFLWGCDADVPPSRDQSPESQIDQPKDALPVASDDLKLQGQINIRERYVVGSIKNVGKWPYDYASVKFKIKDTKGNVVDTASDILGSTLNPGEVWKFKALITFDGAGDVDLEEIDGSPRLP